MFFFYIIFFVGNLKVNDENSRIRIQDPGPDPDPHQNVMDPQHCLAWTLKKIHSWFSTVLLSDKMEEKVQQIQFQQEISNYKDEIRDLQEKLETLKVRNGAKKALENNLHRSRQKCTIYKTSTIHFMVADGLKKNWCCKVFACFFKLYFHSGNRFCNTSFILCFQIERFSLVSTSRWMLDKTSWMCLCLATF